MRFISLRFLILPNFTVPNYVRRLKKQRDASRAKWWGWGLVGMGSWGWGGWMGDDRNRRVAAVVRHVAAVSRRVAAVVCHVAAVVCCLARD